MKQTFRGVFQQSLSFNDLLNEMVIWEGEFGRKTDAGSALPGTGTEGDHRCNASFVPLDNAAKAKIKGKSSCKSSDDCQRESMPGDSPISCPWIEVKAPISET